MRFTRREPISKEEENYIRFTAYNTLIEFGETSLPVLSEFDQIINSSIFIVHFPETRPQRGLFFYWR